jgi:thioredoxin reductase
VSIVHRGAAMGDSIKYWVKPDIDNRIKEGSIPARFDTRVVEIRPTTMVVERQGTTQVIDADAVFLLTGYGSDTTLLRHAGVAINAETCGPVFHSETFETNVPGLYTVGAVIAGVQSGKIFIENGRFHGEKVIEGIRARLK